MTLSNKTLCIQKEGYTFDLYLDYYNERVRIDRYRGNIDFISTEIDQITKNDKFTKIIFYSKREDWQHLLRKGYLLEAVIKGYFNGGDCYVMSLYKNEQRKNSSNWIKEDDILFTIFNQKVHNDMNSLTDYHIRFATEKDVNALASLYQNVFNIYPTPIHQSAYIRKLMNQEYIFFVAEKDGQIVSAASADINMTDHHAELTDCATLPDYRKHGLIKILLKYLEQDLIKKGIYCTFSIARALSYGMNAAFYQLGYQYGGRMMNNCYIFDKMEDMNIWTKDLTASL